MSARKSALTEKLGLDGDRSGVIVLGVVSGPAARLGLRPGDIIVEASGHAIDLTETLERVLEQQRSDWSIAILRDGETLRVIVRG